MTAEELLRVPHNDMSSELIEGELVEMSPAMPEHGWLVDPPKRIVTVYAPGREPVVVGEFDALDGEDELPGSRLPLGDRFGAANGDHGSNGAGDVARKNAARSIGGTERSS